MTISDSQFYMKIEEEKERILSKIRALKLESINSQINRSTQVKTSK